MNHIQSHPALSELEVISNILLYLTLLICHSTVFLLIDFSNESFISNCFSLDNQNTSG